MKTKSSQDQALRHPGDAESGKEQDHSEALGEGIARFVGYIRSFDAEDRQAQETQRSQQVALTALI